MKYNVVGFEVMIPVRFTKEQEKMINKIIRKDDETYDSVSHFIRASTIRWLREERKRLKI